MIKEIQSEALEPLKAEHGEDGNPEYIAVIAAAIAAYEGGLVTSNLIIRRINRVAGPVNAWNGMGRLECITSRKL